MFILSFYSLIILVSQRLAFGDVCKSLRDRNESLLVFGELENSLFLLTEHFLVATPAKSALTLQENGTIAIDLREVNFTPLEDQYPVLKDSIEFQKCRNHLTSVRIQSKVDKHHESLILQPNEKFSFILIFNFGTTELKIKSNRFKASNVTILSQHGGQRLIQVKREPNQLIWSAVMPNYPKNAQSNNETNTFRETACDIGGSIDCHFTHGLSYHDKQLMFNKDNVSVYHAKDSSIPRKQNMRHFIQCDPGTRRDSHHRIPFGFGIVLFLTALFGYWVFFCLLFVATRKMNQH